MLSVIRLVLRTTVRAAYDIQKLRIQIGNRIVGNFRAKLGQAPGKPTQDLGAEEKKLIEHLKIAYKKMMDGLKPFPRKKDFVGNEVISEYAELVLMHQYVNLEREEEQVFKRHLPKILEDFPIWTEFLKDVRGVGPAMAGVIISEFDIEKCRYPSTMWAYCGLDVAKDGRGRSRRKEHLVEREYVNAKGDKATRMSVTYNPWLKTKLMGVLASSFLRAGSEYRDPYDRYKHRMENHAVYGPQNDGKKIEGSNMFVTSPARRHMMSQRYMIKEFLKDLYNEWRALEGLPVALTYAEDKLGRKHGGDDEGGAVGEGETLDQAVDQLKKKRDQQKQKDQAAGD